MGLACVSLSLSVPGVGTAHPSACADQRGDPPRAKVPGEDGRDDAGEPAAAYHEQPIVAFSTAYGAAATWLLPSSCGGSVTKNRDAEPVRRRAHESQAHNGDASHRHGHASVRSPSRHGELPALAVRRMLRQHDCAESVASDGGGGGAGEAEQDEQAGMARAVAAARCARARAWPPKFAEGRERGLPATGLWLNALGRPIMSQRTCMLP